MLYLTFVAVTIIVYVLVDVNYFLRTLFSVLCGRIYQGNTTLKDVTTIYGWCTLQDCDISFKSLRLARIVRELDFARYHFYDRTGVYARSCRLHVESLQGCTLTSTFEDIPLWSLYKINTKLIFWDKISLFFEHEVITLFDGKTRLFLVSRQHALSQTGDSIEALLKDIPGSDETPACPDYIKDWLASMAITSSKLRPTRKEYV